MKKLNIGMLGLGVVGTGVAKVLFDKKADSLSRRIGVGLNLKKICVRSLKKKRSINVPKGVLTSNPLDVLTNPEIDLVIELIGGLKPALGYIQTAFKNGKSVVTANKALLAERGQEIFLSARKSGQSLSFEASVCGGIPVIHALRDGLVGNRITRIIGILNGTCNYILSQMSSEGNDYKTVLKEAQNLGYAETPPTLDVNGSDSAHKLAILAELAFGGGIRFSDIYVEGIENITADDITYAGELGFKIKLLGIANRTAKGLDLRVHPALVPKDNPLAHVDEANNAVVIAGDLTGETMYYGQGAGAKPTASSVLSDLVDLASGRQQQSFDQRQFFAGSCSLKLISIDSITRRYYLRLLAKDQPGVLHKVSGIFTKYKISISSLIQKEGLSSQSYVPIILTTNPCLEGNIKKAVKEINKLAIVRGKTQVFRAID